MLPRYDQRKSPTPSYLGCIFTLAARGAYVDLHNGYVNEQDTPIHDRTYARRSKLRRLRKAYAGVKIKHLYRWRSPCKVWTSELPLAFTLFT